VEVAVVPCSHPCWLVTDSQLTNLRCLSSVYSLGMDRIENIASSSSSVVVCSLIAADTYLPCLCLAMATSIRSTSPIFQPSCHSSYKKTGTIVSFQNVSHDRLSFDCPFIKDTPNTHTVGYRCKLCICETYLKSYECLVFAVSKKQTEHSMVGDVLLLGQLNQGTWKPCEMERVLRGLCFSYQKIIH
jgi:hypothetical protein